MSDPFVDSLVKSRHMLVGYALQLTDRWADAEDLAQETFVRALKNRSQFQPGTNMIAWLRVIAYHLHISACRRNQVLRLVELAEADGLQGGNVENEAIARMDLRQALVDIDPVVALTAIGMSEREIGARLGMPVGAVHWRRWRRRARVNGLTCTRVNHGAEPRLVRSA